MFDGSRLLSAACMGLALAAAGQAGAAPSCPNVGFALIEPAASPAARLIKGDHGRPVFVRKEALTTTADIAEIKTGADPVEGVILLKFKPAAAARLEEATTGHSGLRMAFVADDEALLAITWTGPYGIEPAGMQVTLSAGPARARRLVEDVRKCMGAGG